MHGKCPKCEKPVLNLRVDEVDGKKSSGTIIKCITLICPLCATVLSAQIHPVPIRNDLVKALRQ